MPNNLALKYSIDGDEVWTGAEYPYSSSGRNVEGRFVELFDNQTFDASDFHLANDDNQDLVATAAAIKSLLSTFSMHLSPAVRKGILAQSKRLIDPDDWDADCLLPSIDSFRTMLRALVAIDPERRPNLGLSDEGMFLGMWFRGDESFTVEFRPEDRVNWIAATIADGEKSRTTGNTPTRKMIDLIKSLDVRELIDGPA